MNLNHHSFRQTLAAALVIASCAFGYRAAVAQPDSQGQEGHGRQHHSMLERLTAELSLTSAQQAALKPILDQMRPPGPPPDEASSSNTTRRHHPPGGGGNRAALDAKLKEILTPEQLAKWEQLKAKHRPPGPPPGGGSKQEQ